MCSGHEIACHTYAHEVPTKVDYRKLTESVKLSVATFKDMFNIELKGFRSPESKWNAALIEILKANNFCWNAEDEDARLPYNLISGGKPNIIRLPVTFDDFSYVSGNVTPKEMLFRLKGLVAEGIKKGDFVVIGFHPWIQGMKEERIKAFEEFISYLASNAEIALMTLGEVCQWWNKRLAK
jgi:peptidoglycan/xylan/chitin deacetylase (PgdA/CDA1 family)